MKNQIKGSMVFDVFSSGLLKGNRCAIIELDKFLPQTELQSIAKAINLPATTFLAINEGIWHIRWFSPLSEIQLCGHGALAASAYLHHKNTELLSFQFKTSCNYFESLKNVIGFEIRLPQIEMLFSTNRHLIENIFDRREIVSISKTESDVFVVELVSEQAVKNYLPDFSFLKNNNITLVITAFGESCDYVLRYFAPSSGFDEDDATGSIQMALAPLWSKKLNKSNLVAIQLSRNGGMIFCEFEQGFVIVKGSCELRINHFDILEF